MDVNPRPVAPATYSIYGTVTDIATGENIPNAQVNCEGKTYQVNDGYNIAIENVSGSKDVTLTFTAPNYNTITRTVTIKEVEDGKSANYSVSVFLKQNVEKDVLDTYKVGFKVVDMEGNAVNVEVVEPVLVNGIIEKQAGSTFTVRTAETKDYKAQVTTVTLPVTYSKESVAQPAKTYEAKIYVEKQAEPVNPADTYTNISGVVVDKNGKLLNAEIKLVGGIEQTEQGSAFCFSIKDTEAQVAYHVEATVNGVTVKSPNFSVPACGNQNITLVFTEIGDENAPKDVLYDITFKAYDAETLEPLSNVVPKYIFDGNVLTDNTATEIEAGKYEVRAIADKYYVATAEIELAAIKNETGKASKTIAIYFTKKPSDPVLPTKVYIYGEVLDKRGYIVPAQSIKLYDGTTLAAAPIYNKGSYAFEMEVAEGVTSKTWKLVAEIKDENNAVKQATVCTYDGVVTAINTNIQFIQFNIDENGKVEKPATGDEGESGSLTPDQNVETGEVTNTVEVSMTGNDAAGEEDKTTMILSEGTVITGEDNKPVVASIVVIRDTEEEKNPSDTPEGMPTPSKSVEQPIVIRAYEGFPDGVKFSKPLEFAFTDVYGGQLGNLKLEYYNEGNDAWEEETENAGVELSGNTYTMKVPHFSKFRAAVKNTLAHESELPAEGTTTTYEHAGTNSSLEVQTLDVTYKGNIEGTIFSKPLNEVMAAAQIDNARAQAIIANIIKSYFAAQGIVVADQFTAGERTIAISLPATTMVKNFDITPNYEDITYSFSIDGGKSFEFTIRTLSNIEVELGETQSVSHGHSHGDNWNAGGGIIVSE
ncbi:DUF3869 domain-containing protein [Bacteroides sp.]